MSSDSSGAFLLWTIEKPNLVAPPADAGLEYRLDAAAAETTPGSKPYTSRRRMRRERLLARMAAHAVAAGAD